ncbi:MAG: GTPase Era [Thermoanaerobacteraceae bacterium]|nr:GTPase Era [Thermoanaerobacteraceae bacterium]
MVEKFRSGFVSIIGRPNAGKSTLLNQIIGQKISIMSEKPQTTRNKIQGVWTTEKAQVIFIDTPGIHKPKHALGEYMVKAATGSLAHMDLILYMVDVSLPWGPGEDYIVNLLKEIDTPVFFVANKIDLVERDDLLAFLAEAEKKHDFAEFVPISATEADNLDTLKELIITYLPEGPRYYPEDVITDQPERFLVSELIREKVLFLTREEVPHSIAVVVEEMRRRSENLVYVNAVIYVERDSQKGILIGRNGAMLKQIGKLAREDIQTLLGSKIYLDLWVKVKKGWRKNVAMLKNFGYDPKQE